MTPRNFAFPNLIPGRHRLPPDFQLWPDLAEARGLPTTPPIPPTVNTGDVITASHENTVTTAIADLWANDQWLASQLLADPTTTKGDLITRDTGALARLAVGAAGTALLADPAAATGLRWGSLNAAAVGAVPTTRQVIAGAGLGGGGPLSADVTLTANVQSVFGRTGAVVLTGADITGAGGVLNTRKILAGTGLTGGGDLSADRTLAVVDDTSIQRARFSKDGAFVAARRELNVATGANVTLTMADDAANNRVNLTIAAAAGGAGGSQTPWTSDIDAASFKLLNAGGIGVGTSTPGLTNVVAGRAYATVKGATDFGVLELAHGHSDSLNGTVGMVAFTDPNNTQTSKLVAAINALVTGTTAGNRGGSMTLHTRADAGSLVERVRIDQDGNVGIGGPNPVPNLLTLAGVSGTPSLRFASAISSGFFWDIGRDNGTTGDFLFKCANGAASAEFARISKTGNVSIGGVTAAALLHVKKGASGITPTVGTQVFVENAGAAAYVETACAAAIDSCGYLFSSGSALTSYIIDASATWQFVSTRPALFNIGGSERMRVTNTAVGIGTATPLYLLDVKPGVDRHLFIRAPFSGQDGITLQSGNDADSAFKTFTLEGSKVVLNAGTGGNVAVGALNAPSRLTVTGTSSGYDGSGSDSILSISTGTGLQTDPKLLFGIVNSQYAWIQSAHPTVAYRNLVLQPGGGNVGVGTTNPLVAFQVQTTTPTSATAFTQFVVSEGTNNPLFRLQIGFGIDAGSYKGAVQSLANGAGAPLLLNPQGGNVGVGTATPNDPLHVNGAVRVSGALASTSLLNSMAFDFSSNGRIVTYGPNATSFAGFQIIQLHSDATGLLTPFTVSPVGKVGINLINPTHLLELGTDDAAKPGTTTWQVTSDARTKRNIRPYHEGLATLLQLRPTAYEYNGEANTPAGMKGVGFVAQEAAAIIPACVRRTRGTIAGEETDVLGLQLSDVTFMLVNALREIDERLRRMEGTN